MVSGGAPLPAETMAVWHMLGVNVCEMYGQTETAGGIIAGQRGPFPRPGDVGTVPEGFEVKLADDGEILVRSPDLFEGYWNNPEASQAVLGTDGWMRTGDVGEWRDGSLRLVDRARDFLVTSGGKTISPSFIENALRASPYLAEAVVFGHAPQVPRRARRDRLRDGGRLGAHATTWPTPASPASPSTRACRA